MTSLESVIVGAAIAFVPSLVALAGVYRSAQATLQQAQLTLAGSHAEWLRDQRAAVYLDLGRMMFQFRAEMTEKIKPGSLSDGLTFVANARDILKEMNAKYSIRNETLADLSIKLSTLCSQELADAFDAALLANFEPFKTYADAVGAAMAAGQSPSEEIDYGPVQAALDEARAKEEEVFRLIGADQQWTDNLRALRSVGRNRPRRSAVAKLGVGTL
jgi:hypothetical protein